MNTFLKWFIDWYKANFINPSYWHNRSIDVLVGIIRYQPLLEHLSTLPENPSGFALFSNKFSVRSFFDHCIVPLTFELRLKVTLQTFRTVNIMIHSKFCFHQMLRSELETLATHTAQISVYTLDEKLRS